MKKILYFITQSEFGGAQRYVFDLANNLKTDFQVAVAIGEQGNNGKLAKIMQKNNIKFFVVPRLKRNISPLNDALALLETIKLIKNYQPDVIHLNRTKISILGSLAAWLVSRSSLRVVYTVHGWVFNEPLSAWLKYFYIGAEKFTAKFKDKIICVSEYDKLVALKHKIAPAKKLVTIHNGLALRHSWLNQESSIQKLEQISGSRIKSGMTNNIVIGSIGNLYKTKGYEYLIEAANILINKNKLLLTFIIIGDGDERKKLKDLIKKYGLENNFILAGRIDEAAKLLKAFDIYVCSSVKEGLPYSILEAMSASLP
ncbi:glycosyltransferase, partial [Candidatus Falkowbacteria bacterium]|nr:glycosyltransferase [Candidatus Falkowbacteria bacterium]